MNRFIGRIGRTELDRLTVGKHDLLAVDADAAIDIGLLTELATDPESVFALGKWPAAWLN
jgi:hypothetical protein